MTVDSQVGEPEGRQTVTSSKVWSSPRTTTEAYCPECELPMATRSRLHEEGTVAGALGPDVVFAHTLVYVPWLAVVAAARWPESAGRIAATRAGLRGRLCRRAADDHDDPSPGD